jgi:hypothetical protein
VGAKGGLRHNGGTFGAHSFLPLSPARRIGVAVLTNTATPVVDSLAARLLLLLAGDPPRPLGLPV